MHTDLQVDTPGTCECVCPHTYVSCSGAISADSQTQVAVCTHLHDTCPLLYDDLTRSCTDRQSHTGPVHSHADSGKSRLGAHTRLPRGPSPRKQLGVSGQRALGHSSLCTTGPRPAGNFPEIPPRGAGAGAGQAHTHLHSAPVTYHVHARLAHTQHAARRTLAG